MVHGLIANKICRFVNITYKRKNEILLNCKLNLKTFFGLIVVNVQTHKHIRSLTHIDIINALTHVYSYTCYNLHAHFILTKHIFAQNQNSKLRESISILKNFWKMCCMCCAIARAFVCVRMHDCSALCAIFNVKIFPLPINVIS